MAKTMKLGDRFFAAVVGDNQPLVLHDVLADENGDLWAIALSVSSDENVGGVPYVIAECDIDVEVTETILALPKKGKK